MYCAKIVLAQYGGNMKLQFASIPIYENSDLSLPKLVCAFGVTRDIFAQISGVSKSLLSRKGPISPITRVKLSELVSIYTVLWKLLEGDESKIIRWLHESQDQYWGLSPVQFMKIDKKNIQTILRNLQESRYGEAMGA
jgi:hypothetical protein